MALVTGLTTSSLIRDGITEVVVVDNRSRPHRQSGPCGGGPEWRSGVEAQPWLARARERGLPAQSWSMDTAPNPDVAVQGQFLSAASRKCVF